MPTATRRSVSETTVQASPLPTLVLNVEHLTQYRYATSVELAHHLAYLRPLDGANQTVEHFAMQVQPAPQHRADDSDSMGNQRSCFTVTQPHRELEVQATSRVRLWAPIAFDAAATLAWESVRERLRYGSGHPYQSANPYVHGSPYVPLLPRLVDWGAAAFTPGRPVAQIGIELMARLHAEFSYRSASTVVDTPLAESLARREGVCQDFAHILIGALRSRGLAARYVSGYLLTAPPDAAFADGAGHAPWQGADASHAWVALWCAMADGDAAHWLELDPTNNVLPTTHHVRLAMGRDYGDVTPLRGVIRGGGEHELEVRVRTVRSRQPG